MKLNRKHLPILITVVLFFMTYLAGSLRYDNFFSTRVFLNLFIDNSFLFITSIGMTLVIISGGIDLSVAGVMALTAMVSAVLVEYHHFPITAVIPIVLLMGTMIGFTMGVIIHYFKLQPFIITLAGLFFTRGMCYVLSVDAVTITDQVYVNIAKTRIPVGEKSFISIGVIIFLVVLLVILYLTRCTRFGRNIYAIGGSESSAVLMGLPVGLTKVMVYTLNGFLSSLAGIVFTFYMLSGYGRHLDMLELDVIAAVVIGGTQLTGGYGYVIGTVFGVLIEGVIQTIIMFEGTLNSWWTSIMVGLLTLFFIAVQRILLGNRSGLWKSANLLSGQRKKPRGIQTDTTS
ncbi:MAG: sugar ABC transporter permease YjfF [Anaerolineales bacterium]|nr:sugar ABC transporter permease YjfF [Anaerolineales bacterium]